MPENIKKDDELLNEVKSTGDESEVMDPVTPEGKGGPQSKRKADKKMAGEKADSVPKETKGGGPKYTPRPADKTKMEELTNIFGEELSEDAKNKIVTIFQAAVSEEVESVLGELEEEYETKLSEAVESHKSDMVEKIDSYLNYVVEAWADQNKEIVENNIRAEMAESFMDDAKALFEKHYVTFDETDTDLVEEMADRVDELVEQIEKLKDENITLKEELTVSKLDDIFEEVSDGLADSEVERFEALTENLDYANLDDYKSKLEIIKESYFSGAKGSTKKKMLSESVDEDLEYTTGEDLEEDSRKTLDPKMRRYAEFLDNHST